MSFEVSSIVYDPGYERVEKGLETNFGKNLKNLKFDVVKTVLTESQSQIQAAGNNLATAFDTGKIKSSSFTMALQIALKELGYYKGPLDGIYSTKWSSRSKTRAAVHKFQTENTNLTADSRAGTATLKILNKKIAKKTGTEITPPVKKVEINWVELRAEIVEKLVDKELVSFQNISLTSAELEKICLVLVNFKKMKRLSLNNTGIEDITPVKKLTNLADLYIPRNNIEDITPLESLESLRDVGLDWNPIKDFSVLRKLNLTEISLWKTNIKDMNLLKHMKLTYLNISENNITDISILKDQKLLEIFLLDWNLVTDISTLVGFNNLDHFAITNTNIEEIALTYAQPIWGGFNGTENEYLKLKDLSLLCDKTSLWKIIYNKWKEDESPLNIQFMEEWDTEKDQIPAGATEMFRVYNEIQKLKTKRKNKGDEKKDLKTTNQWFYVDGDYNIYFEDNSGRWDERIKNFDNATNFPHLQSKENREKMCKRLNECYKDIRDSE